MKLNTETKLIVIVFWVIIISQICAKIGTHYSMGLAGTSVLASSVVAATLILLYFVNHVVVHEQ